MIDAGSKPKLTKNAKLSSSRATLHAICRLTEQQMIMAAADMYRNSKLFREGPLTTAAADWKSMASLLDATSP
ncbi:hypothetical protein ACE103_12060 [Bradyrhizobium sp. ma5]|uniref:hypothetical protein n=1 Tax=Bradyrhizobium sp. ma5 TaxID=3344828 RepID=UPI0035D48494